MSASRINRLAERYNAATYLEIGVKNGATFFNVNIPTKVAVDPNFLFDPKKRNKKEEQYYALTSDAFFAVVDKLAQRNQLFATTEKKAWDIIFIDGLHTFEQSYRDFQNTLKYSHENTIWVLDDVVPDSPWSALPDLSFCAAYRKHAVGAPSGSWHGDVFKTLFAIHDVHPEFSYCTVINDGNPQAVLWHTPAHANRKPVFNSIEQIATLSYFDFLKHSDLILPVQDDKMLLNLIGMSLNPLDYKGEDTWKKLCPPIITQQEQELSTAFRQQQATIVEQTTSLAMLTKRITQITQKKDGVIKGLQDELNRLKTSQK